MARIIFGDEIGTTVSTKKSVEQQSFPEKGTAAMSSSNNLKHTEAWICITNIWVSKWGSISKQVLEDCKLKFETGNSFNFQANSFTWSIFRLQIPT